MFSYAIVIFELITGERPYKELQDFISYLFLYFPLLTLKELTKFILAFQAFVFLSAFLLTLTETPLFPAGLPAKLEQLIVACWDDSPAKRPSTSFRLLL